MEIAINPRSSDGHSDADFRVAVQQLSYFRTPLLLSLEQTSHGSCLNSGHCLGSLP
jgi:hypothetical protein